MSVHQGELYWIGGSDIMTSHLDGTGVTTLAANQEGPTSLMPRGNYLYYSASLGGGIYRVPVSGGPRELVAAATTSEITVSDSYVFWYDKSDFNVHRVPVAGGAAQAVFAQTMTMYSIRAVDDDTVAELINGGVWALDVPSQSQALLSSFSGADGATMDYNVGVLFFQGRNAFVNEYYVSAYDFVARQWLTSASRETGLYVGRPFGDEHFMFYSAQNRELDGTISTSVYRGSLCGLPHEELFREATMGYSRPAVSEDFVYFSGPTGVLRIPR